MEGQKSLKFHKNIFICVSNMQKVFSVPYDLDETLVHVLM